MLTKALNWIITPFTTLFHMGTTALWGFILFQGLEIIVASVALIMIYSAPVAIL